MPLGSEDKVDNLFRLGKVQELLSYPPYYSVVGSSLIGQRANDQIEESRENRINVAIDNLIKERDDNNVNPMSKTLD